jgi:cytochrome oxidase Cu insertion factor (SCO1/SenC/PrrC family)
VFEYSKISEQKLYLLYKYSGADYPSGMNQRISLIVLVLLICVGAGWNAWRLVDRERAQQPLGTLGGDFVLTDMQGRSLDSHSLRGS